MTHTRLISAAAVAAAGAALAVAPTGAHARSTARDAAATIVTPRATTAAHGSAPPHRATAHDLAAPRRASAQAALAARRASTTTAATLRLSASGVRSLKAARVSLGAGAPARAAGRTLRLPLRSSQLSRGATARFSLGGTLRFRSGRRTVTLKTLRLAIGPRSARLTGRAGGTSLALTLTVRSRTIDGPFGASGRLALTRATAKALAHALRLPRVPRTTPLGTLSLQLPATKPTPTPGAPAPAPTPAPTAPPTPAATPAPSVTPAPTPTPTPPSCPAADATPAGSADWLGCALPGSGDLKSWTTYVQTDFPAIPGCPATPGSVTPRDGATALGAADTRFAVTSSTPHPDGSWTIVLSGKVEYSKPQHGIDEEIGDFTIELPAPGWTAGVVTADGFSKPMSTGDDVCSSAPVPYSAQPVLDLDLTGIAPRSDGATIRWVGIPAHISTAGHALIGGGAEPVGAAWGSFTIALPATAPQRP